MSSISHQQAVAKHWDLPNTEIFQAKDVAPVLALESVLGLGEPNENLHYNLLNNV
jgi:hypothetical protein